MGCPRAQAGAGTCLTALSHEGLQAHTGVVIDQIDTVPAIQAWAGLALVHLCKGRTGGAVRPCVGTDSSPMSSHPGQCSGGGRQQPGKKKVKKKNKSVPAAMLSTPFPKLRLGVKQGGSAACQGVKCHHLPLAPAPATYLSDSPPLCILAGTSMSQSCSMPGTSHHSGTPCSHTVTFLQQNTEKKKKKEEGGGKSNQSQDRYGILCTHGDARARQRAQLGATNTLSSGRQQPCPQPQLFSNPSQAAQPFHPSAGSWMPACCAARLSLPPSLPQKSTSCSPSPPARRLSGSQMLWQHFHWRVEDSSRGNGPPRPLPGTGRVPAGFEGLSTIASPAKAGPPRLLFKHQPPAFLFSLRERWRGEVPAAALSRALGRAGCQRQEGLMARANFPLPAAS